MNMTETSAALNACEKIFGSLCIALMVFVIHRNAAFFSVSDSREKLFFTLALVVLLANFSGKAGAYDYVQQAGCIQYDPVDVCGKNAELTLQSRVKGFSCSFTEITSGIEEVYQISGGKGNISDEDYRHMIYIGSQYAARGLIYHYATGEIRCSEKVFCRYLLSQGLTHVFKKSEREKILQNAFNILELLNIRFCPGFKWD